MSDQEKQENRICPGCGSSNAEDGLSKREYRCSKCNLELAHLDVAANGVIRGIFGWLHGDGDIIEDRYRIKSVLGKGGFGATYLVEDTRLSGKRRALKEVPALMFDEYETTLLSRLNHPSIPDIIDRTESDGMINLVLEFGGSRTLGGERKQYPNQRIPLNTLLPWICQLCDVLIYLHSQEPPIVHRDLKPDNILLDENGRIMLIDFGIAKESTPATMTRTLGRAATHGFSPPEQAMGTGTDERSDIYSLAATFYALLSGENPPAAHERVAGKEITPLTQFVPDIAPQLETAILQALNLNVNHRQQTMQEFSQALDSIDSIGMPTPFNNTSYSDRTVLLSKTGHSATLHPPSIKLPSSRITTPHPTSTPEADVSRLASKRNAIALGAGIASLLIAMTLGYLFWPESTPEPQQAMESQNIKETNALPDISIANTGDVQPAITPPRSPPQIDQAKGQTNPEAKNDNPENESSAIDALKKQWETNRPDKQPETKPEPFKHPEEIKIITRTDPIPKPPKSKAKPRRQVPPSDNNWLSEFGGSMERKK